VSWGLYTATSLAPQGENGRWFANVESFANYFGTLKTVPAVGDIVFFDLHDDDEKKPSHVGVVTDLVYVGEKIVIIKTIEGNVNNQVVSEEYRLDYKNAGKEEIATYFKVKPGRAYYMMEAARKIKEENLKSLIKRVSDLDYNIKSGKIDKKLGLQLFILGA
jgi:hypothetical protein